MFGRGGARGGKDQARRVFLRVVGGASASVVVSAVFREQRVPEAETVGPLRRGNPRSFLVLRKGARGGESSPTPRRTLRGVITWW